MAYASHPQVTQMVTQVVVFIALMFAPVNYPAERLPGWFATVHDFLPFQYMAQAMRETLDTRPGGVERCRSWSSPSGGVAGLAVTARILTRRA